MAVCMGKSMEGIMRIYSEFFAGNKDGSAGSQGNVAHSVSDCSGSHCCSRIISSSCHDLAAFRNSQLFCQLRFQCAYRFIAFKKLWHLLLCDPADLQHFFGPAAVLYIQE